MDHRITRVIIIIIIIIILFFLSFFFVSYKHIIIYAVKPLFILYILFGFFLLLIMIKLKTKHGEFDIKPLSFKERRKLHRLEIDVANIDGDKMDFGKYVEMIDWVISKTIPNSETVLADFDDIIQ